MKIFVADKLEPEVIAELKKLGEVTGKLEEAEVLIVRSKTQVNSELLEKMGKLKLVARAGVGLDNVDVPECERRKISVINTPGAPSISVAEHAFGLMLAVARKIPFGDRGIRQGKWLKGEMLGSEIHGKTLGIVGYGRIGGILGSMAKAMGMEVVAHDLFKKQADVPLVGLEELLRQSDFVSLHVALTDKTRHMIDAKKLALMKPNAVLINTARGAVVDEEALYDALIRNKLAGAGLDVFEKEPYDGKLKELDNVVMTPHVAGSTKEAQLRIGTELIEKLKEAVKVWQ